MRLAGGYLGSLFLTAVINRYKQTLIYIVLGKEHPDKANIYTVRGSLIHIQLQIYQVDQNRYISLAN